MEDDALTEIGPEPRDPKPRDPEAPDPEPQDPGPARSHAAYSPTNPTAAGRVGPYRLLELLGEGGMGAVYLAEEDGPVRRQVALKIIKLGMDTKQILARFEAERQALAMMEHDNIARVLNAGATAEGRPYFSMEFVRGEPLVAYCDARRLGIRARLELFRQVCSGVQHAHTKGVIHRDLKPGNVLVGEQDGVPRAKIIDFGLARATDQASTDGTLFTTQGQFVGTPEYMSPEQAGLGGLDIDTRTDVYALGVMLYELLTGSLPFDRRQLGEVSTDEIFRVVREQTPARPSSRLSNSAATNAPAAQKRQTTVAALRRELRGDLDWVVMKAIEKDRTRRYETVTQLAEDIDRHLHNLPVHASAPSAAHRLRKWLQRYRLQAATAALVLLALVVGLIGTAWQARVAEANAVDALARLEEADAITGFVEQLFEAATPFGSRYIPDGGPTVGTASMTLRDMLEVGEPMVARAFEGRPLLRARLLRRLAMLRGSLGDTEASIRYMQQALALFEDLPAAAPAEIDELRAVLASYQLESRELDAATTTLSGIRLAEAPARTRAEVARIRGLIHVKRSELDDAERVLLAGRELVEGEGLFFPDIYHALASLSWQRRDLAAAERFLQRAMQQIAGEYGADDFALVRVQSAIAAARAQAGDLHGAERELRRMLGLASRRVGDGHPTIARIKNRLAAVLSQLGRDDEAITLAREALASAERWSPAMVGWYRHDIAALLHRRGRWAEADAMLTEALPELTDTYGEDHPFVLSSRAQLAHCRVAAGDLNGADALADAVLEVDPKQSLALWARGEVALTRGRWRDGAVALDAAAEQMTRRDTERVAIDASRARARNAQGLHDEAATIARAAIELGESLDVDVHRAMGAARFHLGWSTMRTPEGQRELERSVEILAATAPSMAVFPLKYLSLAQPGRAAEHLRRALEFATEHRSPTDIETLECHVLLARQLREHEPETAKPHYAAVIDALAPLPTRNPREGQTVGIAAWEYAGLVETTEDSGAAVAALERALPLLERHLPALWPQALGRHAVTLRRAGRVDAAEAARSRAVDAMQGAQAAKAREAFERAWSEAAK